MAPIDDRLLSYREAYPSLTFALAMRGGGRREVVWVSEENEEVGWGAIVKVEPGELLLQYEIVAHPHIDPGSGYQRLYLKSGGQLGLGLNGQGVCTLCGRYKSMLFFYNLDWGCAKCHGLGNVSGRIPVKQKLGQELLELHSLIGRGRPPGMRREVYNSQFGRMVELEQELKGEKVHLDEKFKQRIFARWTTDGRLDRDHQVGFDLHPLPSSTQARWG